jgi:hypothetical protein
MEIARAVKHKNLNYPAHPRPPGVGGLLGRGKELGMDGRALPGLHHPLFKGNAVNSDQRERFIARGHDLRGICLRHQSDHAKGRW